MKFCNEIKPLYPGTDTSGSSLGVGLLQVRDGMNYCTDEVADNAVL